MISRMVPFSAMKSFVGSYAVMVVKNFNRSISYPDIYLAFNVFIRWEKRIEFSHLVWYNFKSERTLQLEAAQINKAVKSYFAVHNYQR